MAAFNRTKARTIVTVDRPVTARRLMADAVDRAPVAILEVLDPAAALVVLRSVGIRSEGRSVAVVAGARF